MIRKVVALLLGLFLFSVGVVLTVKSNLGTGPWDIFHLGLTNYLPLSFGQVSQVVSLVVIGVNWYMGIKPGWATLFNSYFIGLFIDWLMLSSWIPAPENWLLQISMLLIGVWLMGWATYFYLSAALGAGPRDGFMVGAVLRSGWPVWKIRTIIETGVAFFGWLMGGPIGVGSLVIAVMIGPSIQSAFSIMGSKAQDIEHAPLSFNLGNH